MKFGDETDHGAVCSDVVAAIQMSTLPCAFVGGVLFVISISCDGSTREARGKCGGAALGAVGKTLLRICAASALLCAALRGVCGADLRLCVPPFHVSL